MRSSHYLPLSIVLLQVTLSFAQQHQNDARCYAPNGIELDSSYTPCTPKSGLKHSGCCATNRTTGSPDICLDSGLCIRTYAEFIGTIWHSGCTDPEGKDEGCANMCASSKSNYSTNPPITHFQYHASTKSITDHNLLANLNQNNPPAWSIKICSPGLYCCEDPASPSSQNCCADTTIPKLSTVLGALELPFPISTQNTSIPTTKKPTINASTPSSSSPSSSKPTPTPSLALFASSNTTPLDQTNTTTTTSLHTLCQSERQTASQKTAMRIGSFVGAILGAVVVILLGLVVWMHGREKRQRLLKEHYEEQVQGFRMVRVVYEGKEGEGMGVSEMEVKGSAKEKGVRR